MYGLTKSLPNGCCSDGLCRALEDRLSLLCFDFFPCKRSMFVTMFVGFLCLEVTVRCDNRTHCARHRAGTVVSIDVRGLVFHAYVGRGVCCTSALQFGL